MEKNDYSFLDCKISKENIGEHDADNRFMMESIPKQLNAWKEDHPGCIMIGVCYEDEHPNYKGFFPFVYEDQSGNRFWTHWDLSSIEDYMEAGLL